MSLLNLLKKGSLRQSATATVATVATLERLIAPTVAEVATVAVANDQNHAANDPTPTTTVQADLCAIAHTKSTVASIGTIRPPGLSQKLLAASLALDAQIQVQELPGNDADRWSYPHSTAMNTAELDLFAARLTRFTTKGVSHGDAEALADKLVHRDRERDDRRLCLECSRLSGYGRTSWRCGNWLAAGVAMRQRDAGIPADLVLQLQRCEGFGGER